MNWQDVELVRPGDKSDKRALNVRTACGIDREIDTRDVIWCGHVLVYVLRMRRGSHEDAAPRHIIDKHTGTKNMRWW